MKICLWGDIARALKGNTIGGGELQMALLAKALARGGHQVVVVDYETPEDFITEDGIKVYTIKGWNKGIRIIRTFTHRLPALYKNLKSQKADLYYCRIRDFRHILAFWAARKVKAKFILGLASDLDAMTSFDRLKYQHMVSPGNLWSVSNGLLIELVYPFLLRNADLVFVQHEGQKEILHKKNIHSIIFRNLIEFNDSYDGAINSNKAFIYVGSLDKRKGFNDFLQLVKRTPCFFYKVIGQPRNKTAELFYDELKSYKNVMLLGRLSHAETIQHIKDAKALVSTSPMEGFPNVFLEAWACGIPVFSLYFDPGIIEKENLGKVSHGRLNDLIEAMKENQNTNEFSQKAKSYVRNNHLLNPAKINELNNLLQTLVNT